MRKDFYKISDNSFGFALGNAKVFTEDRTLPLFITVTATSGWNSGNPTTQAIVEGTSLEKRLYYDFEGTNEIILREDKGGKEFFNEAFTFKEKVLIEKLYNAINNPTEAVLTMDQIAEKFGIPVQRLRIKKQ